MAGEEVEERGNAAQKDGMCDPLLSELFASKMNSTTENSKPLLFWRVDTKLFID